MAATFAYADVGSLVLSISYNGSQSSQRFVSRPAGVVLYKVLRAVDGVPDRNDEASAHFELLAQRLRNFRAAGRAE